MTTGISPNTCLRTNNYLRHIPWKPLAYLPTVTVENNKYGQALRHIPWMTTGISPNTCLRTNNYLRHIPWKPLAYLPTVPVEN